MSRSLETLLKLLPSGRAWSRSPDSTLGRYLTAIAQEFDRIELRILDVFRESLPSSAIETLERWSAVTEEPTRGLPGVTVAEQRTAIASRINPQPPTASALVARGVELGATDLELLPRYEPFRAGASRAGDPLTNDPWQHVVRPQATALSPERQAVVEAVLEDMLHSHTVAEWNWQFAFALSGFSGARWLGVASDTTVLETAPTMSFAAMFRIDSASFGNAEHILAKGGGGQAARGYNILLHGGDKIRVDFAGSRIDYDSASVATLDEWNGKTFIVLGTADPTSLEVYIWHTGLNEAHNLRGTIASPPAPTTDDRTLAIGAQRGDTGFNGADNVSILGACVGYQKLTQAEATAWMQECVGAYKLTMMPGEASRWNERDPGGLAVDQAGNVDLTLNGGALTRQSFEPIYHTGTIDAVAVTGQSNARGNTTVTSFPISPTNYQADYAPVQFFEGNLRLWVNLRPVADNNAGPELSLGRELDGVYASGLRVVKNAVGGTSLAIDWKPPAEGDPTIGLELARFVEVWAEAQRELPDPLYRLQMAGFYFGQGEADSEVQAYAEAYAENLGRLLDWIRASFSIAPGWHAAIMRLPVFQTDNGRPYHADIRAAQVAVASARADADWFNTDDLSDTGDGLHIDAAGLIACGSRAAAIFTAASAAA